MAFIPRGFAHPEYVEERYVKQSEPNMELDGVVMHYATIKCMVCNR